MDKTPAFHESILDEIEDHIIVVDVPDMKIRYANRAFLKSYGLPLENIRGRHCYEVTHGQSEPCDQSGLPCPVKTAVQTGVFSRVVHVHTGKDGSEEIFSIMAYPIRNPEGQITHVIEMSLPITEYVKGEEERGRKTELFMKLLETSPDGIIGNDRKGNIFLFNDGAEHIFSYRREDVIGKISVGDIYPPGVARQIKKTIYSPEHGGPGRLIDFETRVVGAAGKEIPIRLSATLICDHGEEIGTIGFFHDISGRKALEQELIELTITDALTGLYNRRHFLTVLQKELDRVDRTKSTCSILMIDLDQFKSFNDTYGHSEGDRLLREVADTIRASIRSMDFPFRFGGEEFVILLPETGAAGAMACAERFRNRLCERDFYPVPGGVPVTVTASIGIVEYRDGDDIEAMVRFADIAMYAAKTAGRNRSVDYAHLASGNRKEPRRSERE